MKYLKFILAIGISVMFYTTVNAQEPLPPHEGKRPVLIDDINRDLLIDFKKPHTHSIPGIHVTNLSSEQNEQIRSLQTEKQKKLNHINNQLAEKKARQRTLEAADKPDMKAINKLIDEQAILLGDKMKAEADYKQKIRSMLTEEQRIEFDSKPR